MWSFEVYSLLSLVQDSSATIKFYSRPISLLPQLSKQLLLEIFSIVPYLLLKDTKGMMSFKDIVHPEAACLQSIGYFGFDIYNIPYQTHEMCLIAVQSRMVSVHIPYVQIQTEDICLTAVRGWCGSLLYIKQQTPAICLAAVQQNPTALQYVQKQTAEVCLEAVYQDPHAVYLIKNLTVRCILEDHREIYGSFAYVKTASMQNCLRNVLRA